MDVNILIDAGAADEGFSSIESAITNSLMTKKDEYGDIIGCIEKSEGEHVTVLKELLENEQKLVGTIAELYEEIIKMLRAAAGSFGDVENNYSEERVE